MVKLVWPRFKRKLTKLLGIKTPTELLLSGLLNAGFGGVNDESFSE